MRGAWAALLAATAALSIVWAVRVPLPVPGAPDFDAWANWNPDEGSHAAVIVYRAEEGKTPPYTLRYGMSAHPPLYHMAAAAWYAVLEPVAGRARALWSVRLLGCLLGLGTVWLTGRAAATLFGARAGWLAAALVALTPARVGLSAALTNENLAALCAAGALSVAAVGLRRGFTTQRALEAGLWCALGMGSKITGAGLLPALWAALAWDSRRRRVPWGRTLGTGLLWLAAALALNGWWMAENCRLYGDPLRLAVAERLWGPLQPGFAQMAVEHGISPLRYLFSVTWKTWRSYWGAFDGMRLFFPAGVSAALGLGSLASLLGLARFGPRWRGPRRAWLVVALGYGALVASLLAAYNWKHYTPQGRFLYVWLVPAGTLGAVGLLRATGRRGTVLAAAVVFLLGLNLYALARFAPTAGSAGSGAP